MKQTGPRGCTARLKPRRATGGLRRCALASQRPDRPGVRRRELVRAPGGPGGGRRGNCELPAARAAPRPGYRAPRVIRADSSRARRQRRFRPQADLQIVAAVIILAIVAVVASRTSYLDPS